MPFLLALTISPLGFRKVCVHRGSDEGQGTMAQHLPQEKNTGYAEVAVHHTNYGNAPIHGTCFPDTQKSTFSPKRLPHVYRPSVQILCINTLMYTKPLFKSTCVSTDCHTNSTQQIVGCFVKLIKDATVWYKSSE